MNHYAPSRSQRGSSASSRPLTPRQHLFVESFVCHGNASRAARQAGYKDAKNQGYRLRHHPGVAVAIEARFRQALENLTLGSNAPENQMMTPEEFVLRTHHMAGASLQSFLWDDWGKFSLSLNNEGSRRDIAMLRSFKVRTVKHAGEEEEEHVVQELEAVDKWPYFHLLGQILGCIPFGETCPRSSQEPVSPTYPMSHPVAPASAPAASATETPLTPDMTEEEQRQDIADMLGIPVEKLPWPKPR